MNEQAYIDWFNKARRNGVITNAVREYYMETGIPLYQAQLDEGSVTLPIAAYSSWQNDDEGYIRETVRQMHSDTDDAVIDQRLRWIAAQADTTVEALRGKLYNSTTLRPLEMSQTSGSIIVGERDYLTQLTQRERMVREIGEALWEANVDADSHSTRLRSVVPTLSLPRRDDVGRTIGAVLNNIRSNCGFFGVHGATIVDTDDGYQILSVERVADTTAYPRRQGTVPSGNMEPSDHDRPEFKMLQQEFVEEVLVAEWENPMEATGVTEAYHEAREDGRIRTEMVSMQLGLVGPDLTMNGLILVDDKEFYHQYIEDTIETCDEHAAVHMRPVDDADAHAEFMCNDDVPAVHRAAQHEALCYLHQWSDIELPAYQRSSIQGL